MRSRPASMFSLLLFGFFLGTGLAAAPAPVRAEEGTQVFLPALFREYDGLWQWEALRPVTLVPAPYFSTNPLLVRDGLGRLHILWDTATEPRFIYHRYETEAGWTEPVPVAETLGYSSLLYGPLVDEDGGLHLAWHNHLGYGIERPYRLMYAYFDGRSWQAEQELWRSENQALQAMPHRGMAGQLQVTMLDSSFSTTSTYQLTQTGAGWTSSEDITPNRFSNWTWPDAAGGVHFYGIDYTRANGLIYSHWQDGRFLVRDLALTGTVYGRETQFSAGRDLLAFWLGMVSVPGGTVTGLHTQCLDRTLAWQPETIVSGQQAVVGYNSQLSKAAGGRSAMALAWEESAPSRFRVGLWTGCRREGHSVIPELEPQRWDLEALTVAEGRAGEPDQICVLARKAGSATEQGVACGRVWR